MKNISINRLFSGLTANFTVCSGCLKQPEHTVKFAVSPLVPECNVFTNCHGPQCCSRVSTRVFGKSNRNLEYVIIFFNISVTSKYVINLIIFPYVQDPKIDFLAAYNSRTGNGLVKNSVLPSAATTIFFQGICNFLSTTEQSRIDCSVVDKSLLERLPTHFLCLEVIMGVH